MRARVAGGGILFLTIEGHGRARFVGDLEQKGARTAGRVINRGIGGRLGFADAQDLGDDHADL
ncbi:MAG: hypothetical protein Q8R89_11425, partial [Desulfomicrobium sp.]|nr:hypothetical protein [Desulfomicrobium sp.]